MYSSYTALIKQCFRLVLFYSDQYCNPMTTVLLSSGQSSTIDHIYLPLSLSSLPLPSHPPPLSIFLSLDNSLLRYLPKASYKLMTFFYPGMTLTATASKPSFKRNHGKNRNSIPWGIHEQKNIPICSDWHFIRIHANKTGTWKIYIKRFCKCVSFTELRNKK